MSACLWPPATSKISSGHRRNSVRTFLTFTIYTLPEFWALVGCLLGDEDGLYDPRLPNDRLLLELLCGKQRKIPETARRQCKWA